MQMTAGILVVAEQWVAPWALTHARSPHVVLVGLQPGDYAGVEQHKEVFCDRRSRVSGLTIRQQESQPDR